MGVGTALFGGGGHLFTGGSGGLRRSQALPCSTREGRLSTAQETPASTLKLIPGSRPNNETQKTGTENVEQREVHLGL